MSRTDTIVLIERLFAAANAREFDALLGCLDDDVVVETRAGHRQFGKEAFRRHFAENVITADEQHGDIAISASEDGTRAAAEFTRRGTRAGASGESYSVADGMFFAVETGSIVRVTFARAYDGYSGTGAG